MVLYCFGLDEVSESEGKDQEHMRLPQNQLRLLNKLVKVNENIVGILSAGSSIEMSWQYDLKAILHSYLGGEAGAGAILDILTGKINPSGPSGGDLSRCSMKIRLHFSNILLHSVHQSIVKDLLWAIAIMIQVWYFSGIRLDMAFPTEFAYSALEVDEKGVQLTVTNVGERDGAEVVQLLYRLSDSVVFRPGRRN